MTKWAIIAILGGVPVDTGMFYPDETTCISEAVRMKLRREHISDKIAPTPSGIVTPQYACVPKAH